jgi:hypothetical protein
VRRLSVLVAVSLLAGCVAAEPPASWPREPGHPEFPFVFCVAGNTDPKGGGPTTRILEAIASERPAFLLHAGSVTGAGDPSDAWAAFDALAEPLRESGASLFPAPGPRDLVPLDLDRLREWSGRFPWMAGKTWYWTRCRTVLAVVLDTNFDALGVLRKDQEDWLEHALDSANREAGIRFVFALLPRGPYSNGPGAKRDISLDRLAALLEACPKVRVVFSGVEGSYQRIRFAGKWWVTCGGGGGPRTEVFPTGDRRRHIDSFEGPGLRPFHYLRVRVSATRFALEMLALDEAAGTFAIADRLEEGD